MQIHRIVLENVGNIRREQAMSHRWTLFDVTVEKVPYQNVRIRGWPRLETGMIIDAAMKDSANFASVIVWHDLSTDQIVGLKFGSFKIFMIFLVVGSLSAAVRFFNFSLNRNIVIFFSAISLICFISSVRVLFRILQHRKINRDFGRISLIAQRDQPVEREHNLIVKIAVIGVTIIAFARIFFAATIPDDSVRKFDEMKSEMAMLLKQGGDVVESGSNNGRSGTYVHVFINAATWDANLVQRYQSYLGLHGWRPISPENDEFCKDGILAHLSLTAGSAHGVKGHSVGFVSPSPCGQ